MATRTVYVTDEYTWTAARMAADIRGESLGKYVEAALQHYGQRDRAPCERCDKIRKILDDE